MTFKELSKHQTFQTLAGLVTITGVDTEESPEKCVKGFIPRLDNPQLNDQLQYNLNGQAHRARTELDLDFQDESVAALMKSLDQIRRDASRFKRVRR